MKKREVEHVPSPTSYTFELTGGIKVRLLPGDPFEARIITNKLKALIEDNADKGEGSKYERVYSFLSAVLLALVWDDPVYELESFEESELDGLLDLSPDDLLDFGEKVALEFFTREIRKVFRPAEIFRVAIKAYSDEDVENP